MKKQFLFFIFLSTIFFAAASEPVNDTSYWKSKYESAIGFSQTSLYNWTKGGEKSSFATNLILNVFKDYKKENITWNNYLGLAYGIARMQSIQQLRKTDDKINFLTKGGLYASEHWDYTAFLEFKSQFAEGYAYPNDSVHISRFLAPAYIQSSVGMNYKPVGFFSVFFSPVGSRLTLVTDTSLTNRKGGSYGIYNGNSTLWQVGGSINAIFKRDIMKNINLMSKLDIFTNYSERPDNVVIGWENNILMKVNKYISLNFSSMIIYDEKAITKENTGKFSEIIQFREAFGIGLAYTIFH